jgi:hypothetical protein
LAQYKIFFILTGHFFTAFEPIAQKAGQAAVLGRRTLSMCLWFIPKPMPEFFPSANSINSTSALIVLPHFLKVDYSAAGKVQTSTDNWIISPQMSRDVFHSCCKKVYFSADERFILIF